jgi:hypothetical protein
MATSTENLEDEFLMMHNDSARRGLQHNNEP